jgi:hypothetical protein
MSGQGFVPENLQERIGASPTGIRRSVFLCDGEDPRRVVLPCDKFTVVQNSSFCLGMNSDSEDIKGVIAVAGET